MFNKISRITFLRAFTLVEVLVTVTIIAILAAGVNASLAKARSQSRDSRRLADITTFGKVLEQYNAMYGQFPVTSNSDAGVCIESSAELKAAIVPKLISFLPSDPLYNATACTSYLNTNCYCYVYRTSGVTATSKEYKIFAKAEVNFSQAVVDSGYKLYEVSSSARGSSDDTPFIYTPGGSGNYEPAGAPSFTRASIAFQNDGTQVPAGTPRFDTWSLQKGVVTEDATTNIVNTAGGALGEYIANGPWGGMSATTVNYISAPNPLNSATVAHVVTAYSGSEGGGLQYGDGGAIIAVDANTAYTYSYYIKLLDYSYFHGNFIYVREYDSNSAQIIEKGIATTTNRQDLGGGWWRIWGTWTTTATCTKVAIQHYMYDYDVTGNELWFLGGQLEQKTYATSWQSNSAPRANESINITTTGVVNATQGTIEFRWWSNTPKTSSTSNQWSSPIILQLGSYYGSGSVTLWAWTGNGSEPSLNIFSKGSLSSVWTGTGMVVASGTNWYPFKRWEHIALTWTNGTVFRVYVDGVYKGSVTSTDPMTSWSGNTWTLGYPGTIHSSVYRDVRVSNIVRSDAEIASDSALTNMPIDNATTYKIGANGSIY